jgi:hypothetical protein
VTAAPAGTGLAMGTTPRDDEQLASQHIMHRPILPPQTHNSPLLVSWLSEVGPAGQVTIHNPNSEGRAFANDGRLSDPCLLRPSDLIRFADLAAARFAVSPETAMCVASRTRPMRSKQTQCTPSSATTRSGPSGRSAPLDPARCASPHCPRVATKEHRNDQTPSEE